MSSKRTRARRGDPGPRVVTPAPHASAATPAAGPAPDRLLVAALLGVTLLVFHQAVRFELVSFDDPLHVDNPMVRGGLTLDGVRWAFTNLDAMYWMPAVWLSLMLDVELFGLAPWGFHLTNVLLHVANTALLFVALRRLGAARWPSAAVAALFALHPMHVESVAWVSERKDVLSTLFWLLALGAYAGYVRHRTTARWLGTLALFAVGLMAKSMLVTLPVTLLLFDVWPLRRTGEGWRRLVVEKLPFLVLSAAATLITIVAQRAGGAMADLGQVPVPARVSNALASYVWYLGKLVWPSGLSVFYPFAPPDRTLVVAACVAVLVALSAMVALQARARPYLAVGWLWYLVTVTPVIGLLQAGSHAHGDRYTYVPYVGLFIIAAWMGAELAIRRPRVAAVAAGLVLAACTVGTLRQLPHWRTSRDLYRHALAVTRDNATVENLLAATLAEGGDTAAAIAHYRESLRILPDFPETQNNLANLLGAEGRVDEAIALYRAALRTKPDMPQAHFNLGLALAYVGDRAGAIAEYRTALRLAPRYPDAHYRLGLALAENGDAAGALGEYAEALRQHPAHPEAHYEAGVLLERRGELRAAAGHYGEAVRLRPRSELAHRRLAATLAALGDGSGAARHLTEADALGASAAR
jgi:protein O-mannosyl-transferase